MSFHAYDINELYSNADGSVQFIELAVGDINGENFWQGISITATQGGTSHIYTFPTDLPSSQTANTKVLLATPGFADLGIVTPNFIIPSGFLFTSGGATVNYAGVDSMNYAALPTDGTLSLNRGGTTAINSPTNFSGSTGTVQVQSNVITGTDGADNLVGTAGDDTISGAAGNDTLNGGGGNDNVNGGAGVDTALYAGSHVNYAVAKTASGYGVTGPEGSDTLTAIERLQFSDRNSAIDLAAGEAANNTVRLIGAAFGPGAIQPGLVGVGLGVFDAGATMPQVCEVVAQLLGLNDAAFVTQVYTNLVNSPPNPVTVTLLASLLQGSGGPFTQGQLLAAAAALDLNAANIDLVGLQQAGVEFA